MSILAPFGCVLANCEEALGTFEALVNLYETVW